VIDLFTVASLAVQAGAQILGPLFMIVAGFIGALFAVLSLILSLVELFE